MTRVLPFPKLFLSLLVMWLLLSQSVSAGHLILGTIIAYGASWTMAAFRPEPVRLRHPFAIMHLAMRVLIDIFRSNLAVGFIILSGGPRGGRSGFMTVPLTMRDRTGLAVLAIILTATPGTLWINYDAAKGELLLHVLDLVDEQHWIELITHRYERLLMEIFE